MTYQDITGFETHDISANDDYDLPRTDLGDILNPIEEGNETTDTESGATIETTESGADDDDHDVPHPDQETHLKKDIHHGFSQVSNLASMLEGVESTCLLYTSPSPRDMRRSRMPSSA